MEEQEEGDLHTTLLHTHLQDSADPEQAVDLSCTELEHESAPGKAEGDEESNDWEFV